MPYGVISKLNSAAYFGNQSGKIVGVQNPIKFGRGKLVAENSWLSYLLQYSPGTLSGTYQFHLSSTVKRKSMAASGSKTIIGDVYIEELITSCPNVVDISKPTGVFFGDRCRTSCQKASIRLRNRASSNSHLLGYFGFDSTPRNCSSTILAGSCLSFHSSAAVCYSAGDAHNVSVDSSSCYEQLASPITTTDQNILSINTLKLLSGSCYLPHPAKEETGGEDAHFICEEAQAIGVADGVGGWADVGINAGYYARELMSNSVAAIQEELKGSIDPARVLEKAHSNTKAKGSSTACIIALTDQVVNAINLGDSGFIVIRDGSIVFQSPVQQHGFNFTYQLENGSSGDLPSSGQVFKIPVSPGDVIIAGTDGLFDNLYNNEITAVVVHAVRASLSPEVTAQQIAALARQRALDKNRQTPFSTAAQDAGYRYYGGKLDDTTVVVSYITSSTM